MGQHGLETGRRDTEEKNTMGCVRHGLQRHIIIHLLGCRCPYTTALPMGSLSCSGVVFPTRVIKRYVVYALVCEVAESTRLPYMFPLEHMSVRILQLTCAKMMLVL